MVVTSLASTAVSHNVEKLSAYTGFATAEALPLTGGHFDYHQHLGL